MTAAIIPLLSSTILLWSIVGFWAIYFCTKPLGSSNSTPASRSRRWKDIVVNVLGGPLWWAFCLLWKYADRPRFD